MTPSDEQALSEGCYYSQAHADRVFDYCTKFIRHSKGQWAGQPFCPLLWQREKIINPIFGWLRKDGTRRFQNADIFVAKKNGKSTFLGALGLYLLTSDNEPRAEVYCGAGDKEQASIIFREMLEMVEVSPKLRRHFTPVPSKKSLGYKNNFFKVIAADARTKQGFDASAVFIDELHVQEDREFYDCMMYSGIARRQPLRLSISTAGYDTDSICYERWKYAEKVISGEVVDPYYYGLIYTVPTNLDWKDSSHYHLANPSLGDILKISEMEYARDKAILLPSEESAFRRYRLNQWTSQDVKWIPVDAWDALPVVLFDNSPWYAGLDLASTNDLCAFVLYQPATGCVKAFFWAPEDADQKRERLAKQKLRGWKDYITFHKGPVIDYDQLRDDISKIANLYKIKQIAVDPWNAVETAKKLRAARHNVLKFSQTYGNMSSPTKELERLVLLKKIFPEKNPVLRWCLCNIRVEQDSNGNIKPTKARSADKIDGIIALIMAIGLAMADTSKPSKYNTSEIVEI